MLHLQGEPFSVVQAPSFSPTSKSRLDKLSSGAGFSFSAARTWLERAVSEARSLLRPVSTASLSSPKPAWDSESRREMEISTVREHSPRTPARGIRQAETPFQDASNRGFPAVGYVTIGSLSRKALRHPVPGVTPPPVILPGCLDRMLPSFSKAWR